LSSPAAHFGEEGWVGAITSTRLAASPSSPLSGHGTTQDAQDGGGDRFADPAAVLPRAHIQRIMGAVLNAPVLARQFQQAGRIGFLRGQAGDNPNRFDFLPASFKFPNPIKPRHLGHVRKAHLGWGDLPDRDAAPFDPAMALFDVHELRGKNLPEGSGWLAFEGFLGCP